MFVVLILQIRNKIFRLTRITPEKYLQYTDQGFCFLIMKNALEYIGIRKMPNGRGNLVYKFNDSTRRFLIDNFDDIKPRLYKNAFEAAARKNQLQENGTIQSLRSYFNEYIQNRTIQPDHRRKGFRTYVRPSKYDTPRVGFIISKGDILQVVCRYKKEKVQISTHQTVTREEYNRIFGHPESEFEKTISSFIVDCYALSRMNPFDIELYRSRVKRRIDKLPLYL